MHRASPRPSLEWSFRACRVVIWDVGFSLVLLKQLLQSFAILAVEHVNLPQMMIGLHVSSVFVRVQGVYAWVAGTLAIQAPEGSILHGNQGNSKGGYCKLAVLTCAVDHGA